MQRLDIGLDQLVLAFVLFTDQLLDHLAWCWSGAVSAPIINDVLEQLALARCIRGSCAVSGTPMTVMSWRRFDGGRGFG